MKEIHPALRPPKDTVAVHLRTVPNDLHRALKIAAMDANVSLEQFITDRLPRILMNPVRK